MKVILCALALILVLGAAPASLADGTDYSVPARFVLPWKCGESYRLTWDPQGHWASGKATGIAWDFSMPEGTPLLAPFSGRAVFLSDTRPLETNYGHYVEIVDETGQWLVRLAHLQEPGSGERYVRTGDSIGASGASGFVSAHLHLELLARSGSAWARPDLGALEQVFGIPMQEMVEGALVGPDRCLTPLALAGPVEARQSPSPSGADVWLDVPLYNQTAETVNLSLVQLSLYSLEGDVALAEASGEWIVPAGSGSVISLSIVPPASGSWYVGRVTWQSDAGYGGAPARGSFEVTSPAVALIALAGSGAVLQVGDRPAFTAWVENRSDAPLDVDEFVLEGLRPDGTLWQARSNHPIAVRAGEMLPVDMHSDDAVRQAGYWQLLSLHYRRDGHLQRFARLDGEIAVYGPQLVASSFTLYRSPESAHVLMRIENIGTDIADPDALEVWGWKPNGESVIARILRVAPIEAGQGALVRLAVPLEAVEGTWRFVEAGYWLRGEYVSIPLPGQPALATSATGPDDAEPAPVQAQPVLSPLR
ncbi:MAG: M23 family metallopeptidase [Chloroflexi bacterium]|nr:M23 family metallopeptidase [Chloroflexota bacterium]